MPHGVPGSPSGAAAGSGNGRRGRSRALAIASTIVAVLIASLPTEGQAPVTTPARVGFLGYASPTVQSRSFEAFRRGLHELGWVEGRTVIIESRWADGDVSRLPALAAELVRLRVQVIVTGGTEPVRAVQRATRAIPIVSGALLVDPVGQGFAASLARPGGNFTGLASQYEEIVTKQVELLAEAAPGLARLGILKYARSSPLTANAAAAAADRLGLAAQVLEVGGVADFEGAFGTARAQRAQALLVLPNPFFNAHRRALIALAAGHRLPALYEQREFVTEGGFLSYGVNIPDMYGRAAGYVDRILRGARPGDLPIERAATFELVVSLKAAKALGLAIPPSLLARADEVVR